MEPAAPSHPTHAPLEVATELEPRRHGIWDQVLKAWVLMAGGPPFSAALSCFEGLNRGVLLPLLPFIAGSLGYQRRAALIVALLSGSLYVGRAVGAFWWIHRHPPSHPSGRGQMLSSSDMLAAGVLYMVIYLAMGFAQGLAVLICGQVLIGFISGRDSCRTRTSPSATTVGGMMGPLLVLLACTWLPQSRLPLLGLLSLGLLGTFAAVFFVCVLRDNCEPSQAHDSSYQRLDHDGTPVGPVVHGQDHKESLPDVVVRGSSFMSEGGEEEGLGGDLPQRYIRGCNGDLVEAARRWRETVAWRAEEGIDHILEEPQPNYRLIKECYPHFLHRRDRQGHPVYYERLGYINLKRLKASGVTLEETVRYYVFLTEYIWKYVEPDYDHGALVSVLDVENVGIMDLRGDALEFLKAASRIIQAHYVERSFRMFIVNAPGWFSVLWKVITPLLHENTRRKINILGKDLRLLHESIDPQHLPTKYGGSDTAQLGQSPEELGFLEYCRVLHETGRPPLMGAAAGAVGPAGSSSSPPRLSSARAGGGGAYRPPAQRPPSGRQLAGLGGSSGRVLSSQESEEEEEPAVGGWRSLLTPGLRLLERVKGAPLFGGGGGEGGSRPPQANLGLENKFVYDHDRGEWVLQPEAAAEALPVDESEERLIRAIQAAHCHDAAQPSTTTTGSAASSRSPTPVDHLPTEPIVPGPLASARGASISSSQRQLSERSRRRRSSSSSSCGPIVVLLLLVWRGLSLSTLVVVPLYLASDRVGGGEGKWMQADAVALVLAMGAALSLLAWTVNRAYDATTHRQRSLGSALRVLVSAMLVHTALLAAIDPLARRHYSAAVVVLVVALVGASVVLLGGASGWLVGVLQVLYKSDPHHIRYNLIAPLQVVDVLGSVLGPLVFYASWHPAAASSSTPLPPYPLGPGLWFNVMALLSAGSCLCLVPYYCTRPPARPRGTRADMYGV